MREIEIKAKIRNRNTIINKLRLAGCKLGPKITQHDIVFGEKGASDNQPGAAWLRIRTENDKQIYFTYKSSVVGHLDSIEHETLVSDAKELESIILALGFELYSDLTKVRQKGKLGDVEICIDTVPGLGDFIEAEKMMHKEVEHDPVVDELWKIFEGLGISRQQEIHEGYDVLERKKRGVSD